MRALCLGFAAAFCACGGEAVKPATDNPPPPESKPTFVISIDPGGGGAGRIASSPAGIDCPGVCGMRVAGGTVVTLTATAGASSRFDGFGGACQGMTCTFTAGADAVVHASFTALPAAPVLRKLIVVADGEGTITSNPPGISCPGTCAATFVEGTSVSLAALAANQGEELLAWGGACSGAGGCVVALADDAAVTARFGDSCAGLVPSLPQPRIVELPFGDEDATACGAPDTDGEGNVYLWGFYSDSSSAGMWNPGGRIALLQTLQSGFAGFPMGMFPSGPMFTAAPDGTIIAQVPMFGYRSATGPQAKGGLIMIEGDCAVGGTSAHVQVQRVDGRGRLAGERTDLADLSCQLRGGDFIAAAVDGQDHILVQSDDGDLLPGGSAAGSLASRWYDLSGQPLGAWFALPRSDLFLLPAGGVALRVGGAWTATLASGETSLGPPPIGFEPDKWPRAIAGGKAWAMIPARGDGPIDIVTTRGKLCGSVMPSRMPFGVGRDGSLLSTELRTPGETTCKVTVYPRVLQ